MEWTGYLVKGMELLYLAVGTFFDIKSKKLSMVFFMISGGIGLLCNLLFRYQNVKNLACGLLFGGMFLMIGRLTKESIGYGDGIGLMILGIFEGFEGMLFIAAGAFLLSSLYGIWMLLALRKTWSASMPFFPFLLMAFAGGLIL